MMSPACGFSSLGSFLPGKQGLARAACQAGPSAASLQRENGKSKASKNSCNSCGFGSCRKPCYFPLFSSLPFQTSHGLLRDSREHRPGWALQWPSIHTPVPYFGLPEWRQSKSLENIWKTKSQQHIGSLLRCRRDIHVPL